MKTSTLSTQPTRPNAANPSPGHPRTSPRWLAGLLSLTLVLLLGCSAINTLTNLAAGGGAGTVASLWSDVPPVAGATQANLQLPVFVQAIMRATAQGRMDFIAYTSPKAPKEIGAFYTPELMRAQGWTEQMAPCTTTENSGQSYTFCAFGKKTGGKDEVMAIIAVPDPSTKLTQIFYVRVDTSSTPVPTP